MTRLLTFSLLLVIGCRREPPDESSAAPVATSPRSSSELPFELFEASAVAEVMRSLPDIRWQTRRDGDALVNETVIALGDAAPAVATSPGGGSWSSPLGAETLGPRDECMVELIGGLREGLERLGRDEPAEAAKGVAQTLAQLAPALECASKDSEPAAIAKALRSAFVGITARSLDDAYLGSSALALLDESCREHEDAAACSRADAMRARPERVPLALRVEASDCDPDRLVSRGVLTIAVTAKGAWLGETAYGSDLAALERTLVPERREDGVLTGVVVFAEPSLTAAQVQPTLEALARAGAREIGVVVSEAAAPPRILSMALTERSRPSAAGGGKEPDPEEPEPTTKKGLYAMKGPKDVIPRMLGGGPTTVLHLGADYSELRTPAGARIPLRGSTPTERRTVLEEANIESGSSGLAVEFGAAAPWSRLGLALETSCSVELRLVAP
jgi:hypothetical protein